MNRLQKTITPGLWVFYGDQGHTLFYVRRINKYRWNVYHASGDVDVDYGTYPTKEEAFAVIQGQFA